MHLNKPNQTQIEEQILRGECPLEEEEVPKLDFGEMLLDGVKCRPINIIAKYKKKTLEASVYIKIEKDEQIKFTSDKMEISSSWKEEDFKDLIKKDTHKNRIFIWELIEKKDKEKIPELDSIFSLYEGKIGSTMFKDMGGLGLGFLIPVHKFDLLNDR
eukprot:UN25726